MPELFEKTEYNQHQQLVAGPGMGLEKIDQILAADPKGGCLAQAGYRGGSFGGQKNGCFPEDFTFADRAYNHLLTAFVFDGYFHRPFDDCIEMVADLILIDNGFALVKMKQLGDDQELFEFDFVEPVKNLDAFKFGQILLDLRLLSHDVTCLWGGSLLA
jgi:hypothetical protein